MKLTLLLSILAISQLWATETYSQLTKLTLKLEDVKISDALKEIENQSDFFFLYSPKLIDVEKKVSIDADKIPIKDILSNIFDEKVKFAVYDRQIILTPADQSELLSEFQQRSVTGTVTDEKSNPLPGVAVKVKATSIGTLTDASGKYVIANIPQNAILIFSFVGMETQEVAAEARTQIDIVLKESLLGLNEVIVTGYSSQRKKDITGAVSIVDVKSLKSIPSGSGTVALQGLASGVNIISNGSPGSASQFYIRGLSSFGNNSPLILVDGIEGSLDNINGNEIESVQILKDAGSAAIYGVRGSNGVIILTTKKGKAGAPVITYDAYAGVQMPLSGNPFNLVNSQDWWKLMGQGFPADPMFQQPLPDYMYRAPGGAPTWAYTGDPAVDPSKYVFDPNNMGNSYIIAKANKSGTDWFHETFKPAGRMNQTLTVSGGTDKARYLFSLNSLKENGTLIESFLKRYSARINSDFNIGNHIRVGENVYLYTFSNKGVLSPGGGSGTAEWNPITSILSSIPLEPLYDISGSHYVGAFTTPATQASANPVYQQKSQYNNRNNNWVLTGNAYAEVDFLKHFTARTNIGASVTNSYNITFVPTDYESLTAYNGLNRLYENSGYNLYKIWNNTLKYDNAFGRHKLTVLAGTEAIEYSGRSQSGDRQDYYLTDFSYLLLQNGKSFTNNSSSAYINTIFSLFGRLDYSFNDKYLLGLTLRRDGSSKFGADSRYGLFPSVSLGWRISNERFMKNISWINDLKIRASYGELGSQANVDNANAFSTFGTSLYSSFYGIGGNPTISTQGFYPSRYGNSKTGWEKDIISNIGFDATIMNNKIDLSVEIFKKAISGLLFPQPLPNTAGGATAPAINIGDVQNTGFDITGNYRGQIGRELNFTIGANITHYVNKITSIPGSSPFFDIQDGSNVRFGNYVRNEVGHSIGEFYGYQIERLFQSASDVTASPTQQGAAPGMFKYKDINGASYEDGKPDGKIDANDRTFIGNPNPKFTYGINLGLNYKNFDFGAVFYGSYGNKVINLVKDYTYFSYFKWQLNKDLLNCWSPTNTGSDIPIYSGAGSFSEGSVPNSFFVEDGSFLKLRSLILGYTLPASILEKVRIRKLRIYFQAMNLFQITKYSGLDPEVPGNTATFGADLGNYPNNQKQFVGGINLSF